MDLKNSIVHRLAKDCQQFRVMCAEDVPGIIGARTYARAILNGLQHVTEATLSQTTGWALMAIGGFGRGELSFASDIDLLFVYKKRLSPTLQAFIEAIIPSLWDAGFEIGHVVTSLTGLKKLQSQDFSVQTTCLINQFIAGDRSLHQEVSSMGHDQRGKRYKRDFLHKSRVYRQERLQLYGESIYLLEPHIKEGLGGLRDIHLLYWLARVFLGNSSSLSLVESSWLSVQEQHWLEQAEDFLWRVRLQLHQLTNRHQDRLRFEEQEHIANRLGFVESTSGIQAVEAFMRLYYRHTARVRRITKFVLEYLHERMDSHQTKKERSYKILPGPFVLLGDQIRFYEPELIQNNPGLLMLFFWTAAETRSHFYHDTGQIIRENLGFFTSKWAQDSQVIAQFFDILCNSAKAFDVLKAMMETGFLETFLPEFGAVRYRVQHDIYHLYTVDEHLLRTVYELHELEQGHSQETYLGQILPARLFEHIDQKRILYLSGLLHDIGKGEGKGHAEKGAEKAKMIGQRLGLGSEECSLLVFLIKKHLLLAETALKRDLSEERPIERCALEIGDLQRLSMLYLLSVADSRATGPQVWNTWRATLLAELFLKVEHILQEKDWKEKNIQEQVREKQNRLKSQAISLGWKHDLQSWLESLSFRYLLTHPVTTILEHLCLERKLDQVGPQVVFRHLREEIWEMTLVCFDTDRLFDDLTGVLWANGLNVLSADITTRSSGKVVDILQLDQLPDPLHPDALWKRVTDDLLALLEKRETLEKVLEKRDPRPLVSFTKPPSLPQDRIVIDEEASDFYTVIEVYTSERPGVLHMISKVLHEYGLSIQFAKISTPGAQALDVFYVTTKEGDKIRNKNLEHNLTNSLLETLAVHL